MMMMMNSNIRKIESSKKEMKVTHYSKKGKREFGIVPESKEEVDGTRC